MCKKALYYNEQDLDLLVFHKGLFHILLHAFIWPKTAQISAISFRGRFSPSRIRFVAQTFQNGQKRAF